MWREEKRVCVVLCFCLLNLYCQHSHTTNTHPYSTAVFIHAQVCTHIYTTSLHIMYSHHTSLHALTFDPSCFYIYISFLSARAHETPWFHHANHISSAGSPALLCELHCAGCTSRRIAKCVVIGFGQSDLGPLFLSCPLLFSPFLFFLFASGIVFSVPSLVFLCLIDTCLGSANLLPSPYLLPSHLSLSLSIYLLCDVGINFSDAFVNIK